MVCAGYVRSVPVPDAGRGARKGDKVTGNLKVAQPARRRRGVTLIEAVLYISVALALIVGGLVFYRQASFASDFNSLNRLLTAVMAESRAIVRDIPSGGPTTWIGPLDFEDILIANGSVPSSHLDMTKPRGARIVPPLASNVYFNVAVPSYITLVLADVPVAACARLTANNLGRTSYSTNFQSGGSYDNSTTAMSYQSVSVDQSPGASATKCKLSDINNDGIVLLSMNFAYYD
jgi:hypothetical protein